MSGTFAGPTAWQVGAQSAPSGCVATQDDGNRGIPTVS